MDSTLFIVGVIANIISALLFVSPIQTFCRIVRRGSTEGFEPSPYVFTLLNAMMWLYYGLTKADGFLVATVNGFGAVMEKNTVKLAAAVVIAAFGVVYLVTTITISELDTRVMVMGMICVCLTIVMYASPLAVMRTVFNTRSVEYMPFFLSLFLFLNGGIWTAYAVLDRDIFIGIPNGIGLVLDSIQLIIYVIYKYVWVSQSSNETTDDASQASAPLLA